jgi:putative porin
VRFKARGALLLSLVICAGAKSQTQKPTTRKKTSSGMAEQWKALHETLAEQQRQIDELKAVVERLAAANQRAATAGQQANEAAQRAQSAADQAAQVAQTAQSTAATGDKDAQHAEFSAAEAKTAVARDGEKTSANVQSMMKSFSERIKKVGPFSFSGDFRLRDEPFFGGPADASQVRDRMRFRLRVNANAKLSDEFSGGFTLASGDINNPVSVMQTTNQMGTRKPFELDRAFLEYHPHYFKPLTLTGGKITQPWVGTELVWDRDLNPEGLAQTLNFNLESTPVLKRVALVGFELPFAETAGVSLDNKSIVQTAVYGGQLQTEWRLAEWLKFSASTAFYNWHLADPIAFAVATATVASPDFGLLKLNANGNQNSAVTITGTLIATGQKIITNSQFSSKFGLLDTIGRFDITTPAEKWPVAILGDFVQNTKACANVGNILPAPPNTAAETFAQSKNATCNPHQRRGYWLEARAGKSQTKGDLNFAYARIFVEREAVLGAFNYSEIRQATNVSQHKVEAFYQLENNIQLGFTGFFGRPLVTATSTTLENTLKRLQFDITYKF